MTEDILLKDLNGRTRIFLYATTTAIIDDEITFFNHAFKTLCKKNKELITMKNLSVLIRVEADFSNGFGMYIKENNNFRDSNKEEWEETKQIWNIFKSKGFKKFDDIKNIENIKYYHVNL